MKMKQSLTIAFISAAMLQAPAPAQASSEPFLGEIDWFAGNFAPRGWAFCDGQLLPIAQNTALFSLLGTTYGGDGRTTFALPDVRGRVIIHAGNGPGLTPRNLGERGGSETVTLNASQMPPHSHTLRASGGGATATDPEGNVMASPRRTRLYDSEVANVNMDGSAIANAGGGQGHPNMQPYNTLKCIIAIQGLYPSRS